MKHQKIEKILEKVKSELGHIGIIGDIEFNNGTSKLQDVSIFEDGSMRYSVDRRVNNRNSLSYLHLKNEDIVNNILKKINENKFL